MTTSTPSTLEDAIRQSGEGWLIDWFIPQDKALDHIRQSLDAVNQLAKERLAAEAPEISETALLEEYRRNPERVRGFFQALGGIRTPDMLLMVWRIIQGMEVKDIQIHYHRQEIFEVQVIIESPSGVEDAPYTSTSIHDFTLFRHIGTFEVSGRPVFDGFYALKVQGT